MEAVHKRWRVSRCSTGSDVIVDTETFFGRAADRCGREIDPGGLFRHGVPYAIVIRTSNPGRAHVRAEHALGGLHGGTHEPGPRGCLPGRSHPAHAGCVS